MPKWSGSTQGHRLALEDKCLERSHISVLLPETVDSLTQGLLMPLKNSLSIVDATLGAGGHSCALVRRVFEIHPTVSVNLLGFDQDALAIELAQPRLESLAREFPLFSYEIARSNFRALHTWSSRPKTIDLFLADLGMSSMQLDDASRGFSVASSHPLDMRMNSSDGPTASDVLESWSEEELSKMFYEYADEPRSKRLALAIVQSRQQGTLPLGRAEDFARFVETALGYGYSRRSPALRIFQALRIAVNNEMSALGDLLGALPTLLEPQSGRCAFITFHSVEDRMVKQTMRSWEGNAISLGCEWPRGGVAASDAEIRDNPRARSARLRVFYYGESRQSMRRQVKQGVQNES
jgi:16S rRNA (cytosine1402-N4)-methyltransferase